MILAARCLLTCALLVVAARHAHWSVALCLVLSALHAEAVNFRLGKGKK